MSTESFDTTRSVGTLDQAPARTARSPFYVGAIGVTIALVAIAAAVVFLS